MRGDNFPIVDLKAYNTYKEAQFIQINQVMDKITGYKKATEETNKEDRIQFHAGPQDSNRQICHRRRTQPS